MPGWQNLSIGSQLSATPTPRVDAPVLGRLDELPFGSLTWENFERIQWRILRDVLGLRGALIYGDRGQAQFGLDVVALAPDSAGTALQSKKYERFGPAEIKSAVQKFRSTDRPFTVQRLIIGVARPVRTTKALDELAVQRERLHPIELELWDSQELSALLRDRPEIVVEFFGTPTAEAFCLPFKVDQAVVPTVNLVAIREAIARTPEVSTGAQGAFDEAEAAANPEEALRHIERGQALLREAGFGPHAAQRDEERTRLLSELGRQDEAARLVLDEFWRALDGGHSTAAQAAEARLSRLESGETEHVVGSCQSVARAASELYFNPLGEMPDLSRIQVGQASDQAKLVLLAGETALASCDWSWLAEAAPVFEGVAAHPGLDVTHQTRLRLLLADATSDWSAILEDARTLKLGHALLGLVSARYARTCALTEQFVEADTLWDEASGAASLARQWKEASTWILSRRIFRERWKPFTSNELLPLQVAVGQMADTAPPLVRRADGAYEYAMASLNDKRLRAAAISAQRALRDAVTCGDWFAEERSRRILATILTEADEPRLAAHHLVRAGSTKAVVALGEAHSLKFIDITEALDADNYWTVGTSYRLLATQSDLIPDNLIAGLSKRLVDELVGAEEGRFPDLRAFATSRYNNALKLLAGIAGRLDDEHADRVLQHFEGQPAVDEDHYRYHDADEGRAVAAIAIRHHRLAGRAVGHLIGLVSRLNGSSRGEALDALEARWSLAEEEVQKSADAGNRWAQEMLASLGAGNVEDEAGAEAIERLTTPLEHTPGVYTTGTHAVGDSLKARQRPSHEIDAAIAELLERADHPHVGSSDRGDYLVAAANLGERVSSGKRKNFFAAAVRLATNSTPSEHDALESGSSHKLGIMRLEGAVTQSRGEALYLASTLAQSTHEREQVRRLSFSLLGEDSNYWTTRALQQLGDAVDSDLAFLSSQAWAMRSLAAVRWPAHPEPESLGVRLATDRDVRVRRALASALAQQPPDRFQEVREALLMDPAHSVRALLAAS